MLIHVIFLGVVLAIANSICPEKYARFSLQHSFCKDPNPTCSILKKGVDKDNKKIILKVHNKLRSKIATGKETGAGGLPTAADMLQMEWDSELASIAQKWTEQCNFAHDCNDCRRVENFDVGQNMAQEKWNCTTSDCSNVKPNWKDMITEFYKEVKFFDKKYISPFAFAEEFGHFTQVVWAKSWKVGCGYTSFKDGDGAKSIYACNYGPGGNLRNKEMYVQGPPGSACPVNTCSTCKSKPPNYLGLCKIRNAEGPIYKDKKENVLLDCNWMDKSSLCKVQQKEKKGWKVKKALGGSYQTITLMGGEKTELAVDTPVQAKAPTFCTAIQFRKGPASAADSDSSKFSLNLFIPAGQQTQTLSLTSKSTTTFVTIYSNIRWNYEAKISIGVEIPPNAPAHIIDLKSITVYDGVCKIPK